MRIKIYSVLLFSLMLLAFSPPKHNTLTVTLSGFKYTGGEVYAALYNSEATYMDTTKAFRKMIVPATTDPLTFQFSNVPGGEYALGLFQDMNKNGQLDIYHNKIPKEGFGFSNNAKGGFGPPKYKKTMFTIASDTNIHIKLIVHPHVIKPIQ